MIDASGRVIAADASNVVMLDQNGSLLWAVPLPGLNPLSPVILDNGLVVVLTVEGSMLSIDPLTGTSFFGDQLVDTIGGKQGRFATRNTPLVSGNRIYSINEFLPNDGSTDETNTGRLFALDVRSPDQDGPPFELAWSLEFGARSGGSPTIADGVIFFDGDFEVPTPSTEPWDPHIFGVKDMGRYGTFTFKLPMEKEVRGSGTADPYGRGLWYTARGAPWRLLTASGEVIDEINVNDYPELESNAKASIGTFGWSKSGNAVALFTTGWFTGEGPLLSAGSHFYHVGIDIKTKELVYSTFMGNELINWSSCQAATVIDSRGEPVVVIVTAGTGVFGIGRKKTTREQLS